MYGILVDDLLYCDDEDLLIFRGHLLSYEQAQTNNKLACDDMIITMILIY